MKENKPLLPFFPRPDTVSEDSQQARVAAVLLSGSFNVPYPLAVTLECTVIYKLDFKYTFRKKLIKENLSV